MAEANRTFTESANKKYLYGTPEEVQHRLGLGHPNTESNFHQIKPSLSAPGEGLNGMSPGRKSNGNV